MREKHECPKGTVPLLRSEDNTWTLGGLVVNFCPFCGTKLRKRQGMPQGSAPVPFTLDEDVTIINAIQAAGNRRKQLTFEQLADKMDRSPKSIEMRWYTHLKAQYESYIAAGDEA